MITPYVLSARALRQLLLAGACLLAAGAHAPAPAQPPPRPRPTIDRTRAEELLWKGRQLLWQKNDKEALEVFRDAARQFPAVEDTWYCLGVALRRAGEFEESGAAFGRALRLRRVSTTVGAELAYTLLLAGKREDAVSEARRAFGGEAATAEPHYLFALLHLNHEFPDDGAPARALEEAEAAVAAAPDFARAHLLKAQALARLSAGLFVTDERDAAGRRLAEAAQSIEKFLALAPEDEGAAFWRQQLSALRGQSEELLAPEASRAVFSAKELTTKAVITHRPEPLYAEAARRTQTFGAVRVRVVLAADGTVQHALALGSLPNGLTERAVEAARAIQFKPAARDGRPISQFAVVEYNFNIF